MLGVKRKQKVSQHNVYSFAKMRALTLVAYRAMLPSTQLEECLLANDLVWLPKCR